MKKNKIHIVIGIFFSLIFLGFAAGKSKTKAFNNQPSNVYRIKSAMELNNFSLKPGDRIILENGRWTDQTLVFRGDGTKDQPITLTVADPGKVVLKGSSSLMIEGSWLVVDGLSFKEGYTLKENVITFSEKSVNCRLTNTSIINYNSPEKKVRNTWIVLFGKNNRVDHCYTLGKTNLGPTLHVGPTMDTKVFDQPNYHRVDHNYFAGRPPLGRNGGETIVLGSGSWAMLDSYSVIEENIFEHCDGESEIISAKSSSNTIRNNLFYESEGRLYLRHANNTQVYGNYFIGNNKPGTGGIGIMGANHKIYNNYMQGLSSGISIRNAWENPPPYGYWLVKDVQIFENTIVDCKEPFIIGWGKDERTILPPVNTTINNNIIAASKSLITWTEPKAMNPENIKLKNNIAYGIPIQKRLPDGFSIIDPFLKPNSLGIYEKTKRSSAKDGIGAKAMNGSQSAVLNTEGIGPNWMKLKKVFDN